MAFYRQNVLQQLYIDSHDELEGLLFARLRCRDTAADLSQEAFLRLHDSEDLSAIGNLRGYLFRIAMNLLNDHYRSAGVRSGATGEEAEELLANLPDCRSAETVVMAEEQLDSVAAALAELSPLCQRIFYLNRFEGRKHKDIAERLGISVRTVEDNLARALRHCVRRLPRG
ncbi:RNA polymerase sigma factor [Methylogaea oryzae]|uniref:ECF sigma factor VreI n=1 Tax=Methylogaea oryzae TaxID=1295382 RepID=A0A8D5AKI2_9GAMM|nr:RNA polymerase sigma factor [Methylogaea oryzae]BBL71161.1 ECF sigma factor VreI [Methylogaea oryzae]